MKYAFFDVDETLIRHKSMFVFMEFWYARTGEPAGYQRMMTNLRKLASNGASRSAVNRAYYEQYAGIAMSDLRAAGVEWFDSVSASQSLFKTVVVDRLRSLNSEGFSPVFVSGSMRPVLEPIAKALDVKHLICAKLECFDGICTGKLTAMAIGQHKRDRLLDFVEKQNAHGQPHHAYGDHISDLPMLLVVKHPHVVDPCSELNRIARQKGWPVINSNEHVISVL